MKRFLIITGWCLLSIIILAYLAFLFVLPNVIDINQYKTDIQKLAIEQAKMKLDFSSAKLITTPILETGVQINDLNIKLLDDSDLIKTDRIKVKVSLPNIFLLTVRVSEVAIDNPQINIDIAKDGSQYKVVQVIEDILNEQKQQQEVKPQVKSGFQFNPNWIRIKVPNIKISNYSILITDLKSKHYLKLKGNELKAYYNNMKTVKVKTNAQFMSDEDVKINANIDIDTFIPPAPETDEEDDPNYREVISFVNPVLMYRNYNLKTDISTKLKVRQRRNGAIKLFGYADIEDLTMTVSGYQLPKSYFRAKFRGQNTNIDTNLYVTKDENIMLSGFVNYSKKPRLNININTKKIHFKNLITVTKAFMDTLNIKNDLADVTASGYLIANAKIKTNFKKLNSYGGILVRDGNIFNRDFKITNMNANILFLDKVLEITKTYLYINNSIMKAEGKIDHKNCADISLYAEKLPLPGLFHAFAPVELKQILSFNSGNLFIDLKFNGHIKKAITDLKLAIFDIDLITKDKSLRIKDEKATINFKNDYKTMSAEINNDNLNVYLIPTNSVLSNDKLNVVIDNNDINIHSLQIKINKATTINIKGLIDEYSTKPITTIDINGNIYALDIKQILGKVAEPFIDAKGIMPFKLAYTGDSKRQNLRLQIKTDADNYLTPIHPEMLQGKQSIIQAIINFKGSRLNIKDTGLFVNDPSDSLEFNDDFDTNIEGSVQVSKISGTISNLNSSDPFINQIKINLPDDIKTNIHAFKNSSLHYGGNLLIYGPSSSPKFKGNIRVWDLFIPEIYTNLKNLNLDFVSRTLHVNIEDLILNGSDIQVDTDARLIPSPIFNIDNLNISSRNFEVEKLMKTVDAIMKYIPASTSSSATSQQSADIPVAINNGTINFRRISAPPILLQNTGADISLYRNIFYINNTRTSTIGGFVNGDVSVNLLSMLIKAQLEGRNFDMERTFLELMNMKDILSGTASFKTDLSINGAATNQTEQMKGILGTIDFEILKGQLGPFGHLENLILAENIRESEFFQTALGGVINSLTSIQTSHFNKLNGHIEMDNGIAKLNPITSIGPVMCMNISGDMNLLNNHADMKLRARLGSKVAEMLGPIAAVNPINLLKATPGMNVAAAKMFAIFCEEITPEEMNAIPQFETDFSEMNTTNFQIVIRGDTQKPLTLIKSFKWLATTAQIEAAENFVNTLPPIDENNPNATLEELLAAQAEAERIANENIFQKTIRKTKDFFKKFKKQKDN